MTTVALSCREVEAMMRDGASLCAVETYIDGLEGLNEDQRSALWLYAWALQEPDALRGEVSATLALVG